MKPFTINGLYVKPFDKLKMSALERGFVQRWLNLVQLLVLNARYYYPFPPWSVPVIVCP